MGLFLRVLYWIIILSGGLLILDIIVNTIIKKYSFEWKIARILTTIFLIITYWGFIRFFNRIDEINTYDYLIVFFNAGLFIVAYTYSNRIK